MISSTISWGSKSMTRDELAVAEQTVGRSSGLGLSVKWRVLLGSRAPGDDGIDRPCIPIRGAGTRYPNLRPLSLSVTNTRPFCQSSIHPFGFDLHPVVTWKIPLIHHENRILSRSLQPRRWCTHLFDVTLDDHRPLTKYSLTGVCRVSESTTNPPSVSILLLSALCAFVIYCAAVQI